MSDESDLCGDCGEELCSSCGQCVNENCYYFADCGCQ